jgi:hypothetical protein
MECRAAVVRASWKFPSVKGKPLAATSIILTGAYAALIVPPNNENTLEFPRACAGRLKQGLLRLVRIL